MERSINFYQSFLNLHIESRFHFMEEELVFLEGEGVRIELIGKRGVNSISSSHIALQVKNITNCIDQLEHSGYQLSEGPYKLENDWETVFFSGPDGEIIEFVQIPIKSGL